MKTFLAIIILANCATAQTVTIGQAVFSGAGLNDATSGGIYTQAAVNARYVVTISATGTPDHFTWTKNGGSASSPVAISGVAQTLTDGVTIRFAATTGHTLADSWTVDATVNGSAAAQQFVQRGVGALVGRDIQDKSRDVISIRDFGIIGSSSDSTSFLTSAINAARVQGKAVYLPGSPYAYNVCDAAITGTAATPVKLWGDGNAATRLQRTTACLALAKNMITFGDPGDATKGVPVEIDGIDIDDGGDGSVRNHGAIGIYNAQHVRLTDVSVFHGRFYSIAITDSNDVVTRGMHIDHSWEFGLAIGCGGGANGSQAPQVYNYGFSDTGSTYNQTTYGLAFTGFCKGIAISGDTFTNSDLDLIQLPDAQVTVSATTVNGFSTYGEVVTNQNDGIFLEGVNGFNIQAEVHDTYGPGIQCQGSIFQVIPGQNVALPCSNGRIHNSVVTGVSTTYSILVVGSSFPGAISSVTNANPGVFTGTDVSSAHYIPQTGQTVTVSGFTGACVAGNGTFTATALSATTFKTGANMTGCASIAGMSPVWVILGSQISVDDNHVTGPPPGAGLGPITISSCTKAAQAVCTATTAPSTGQTVQLFGMTGGWNGLNGTWLATNLSATTFAVNVDTSGYSGAFAATSPTWNQPNAVYGIAVGGVNGGSVSGNYLDNIVLDGITLQTNAFLVLGNRLHNIGQGANDGFDGIKLSSGTTNTSILYNAMKNDAGLPTMHFGILDVAENGGESSNTTTWGNEIQGATNMYAPTGIPAYGAFHPGDLRQNFANSSNSPTGWMCSNSGTPATTCASGVWAPVGYIDPDARYVQSAAAVMTNTGTNPTAAITNGYSGDQWYLKMWDGSIQYGKVFRPNGTNTLEIDAYDHITLKPNVLGGSGGRVNVSGNMTVTGLAGGGSLTVCADNSGNIGTTGCPGVSAITALTGDVTATGPGSVPSTLVNTAVTPATYGDSSHVASFTVDGKGRLTNAASTAIGSVTVNVNNTTNSCAVGHQLTAMALSGGGAVAPGGSITITLTGTCN